MWKDLLGAAADLKPIYWAADQAELALGEFEKKWKKYPALGKLWRQPYCNAVWGRRSRRGAHSPAKRLR